MSAGDPPGLGAPPEEKEPLIRGARAAEAGALVGVIGDVYREYGFVFEPATEVPDLLDFDRAYDGSTAAFFAAEASGSLVGTIGVKLRTGSAEVLRLYVLLPWRRRGLGRRLVETAMAWARQRGARRIELWSDTRFTAAHDLYRRMGFLQSGWRRLDDVNRSEEFRFFLDDHA
jgi:putative acetyltransferase